MINFKSITIFIISNFIGLFVVNTAQAIPISSARLAWADGTGITVTPGYLPDVFNTVKAYVDNLNTTQYGGFTGWRLPRVYEVTAAVDSGKIFGGGKIWGTQLNSAYWNNFTIFAYGSQSPGYDAYFGCPCYDWIWGESSGQSFYVLGVRDIPVPEPDTVVMVYIGLIGLASIYLARKKISLKKYREPPLLL